MQASNICPALMHFVRLIQLMPSPSLPPFPRVKLCKIKGIYCTVVAHVPIASPFIWFFSPSHFTEAFGPLGFTHRKLPLKQNTCFEFTNNTAWALKERSNCPDFAEEREITMLLFSFTSLSSPVRSERSGTYELGALGHRETSFPQSQPVLSALLLFSLDITYWVALQSKRCSNYIFLIACFS